MAQMKQHVEMEWESLLEEAARLVRGYWDKVHEAKRTRDFSEWNKYGVRVRRRKTTISIEWFFNVVRGPRSDRQHRAFYVSRGKGHMYSPSRFSKTNAVWEKEAIAEFEAAAGPLRERAKLLMRMGKLANRYDALCRPVDTTSHLDEVRDGIERQS